MTKEERQVMEKWVKQYCDDAEENEDDDVKLDPVQRAKDFVEYLNMMVECEDD